MELEAMHLLGCRKNWWGVSLHSKLPGSAESVLVFVWVITSHSPHLQTHCVPCRMSTEHHQNHGHKPVNLFHSVGNTISAKHVFWFVCQIVGFRLLTLRRLTVRLELPS